MFFYNNSDANRDGGRWSRPAQEEGNEDYPDSSKEKKYG